MVKTLVRRESLEISVRSQQPGDVERQRPHKIQ